MLPSAHPFEFSLAESTVLRLPVNCVFRYSEWHLSTVALNIGVKTVRENYSCNYKHQLKRLKNKLKVNKWNNYQAYLCDNFWNKRKVEMRKCDCNSFRITGNTNFKKKLTSFVSKSVWEIQLWKSKLQLNFADRQQALKLLFFDRSLNDCYKWTMKTSQQSCLEFERVS